MLSTRKLVVRKWRNHRSGPHIERLRQVNAESTQSVVGSAPVLVSITSFGSRVRSVFLPIEAIAEGTAKPARIVLWLDEPDVFRDPPDSLVRLKRRGLEVELTDPIGSHAKYYPSLDLLRTGAMNLVTADDDILYPRRWLHDLLIAADESPDDVICHHSHRMSFDEDGKLMAYGEWQRNWSTETSGRVFPLGVSGVRYPHSMVAALRERGRRFFQSSPGADDVWLHYVAASERIGGRQVTRIPTHFAALDSVGPALSDSNVGSGGNDAQIRATYDPDTLAWIRDQP